MEKADIWRSDMLRLLNPKHQKKDSQSALAQVDELVEAVARSCANYAADCITKLPLKFLRKHMEEVSRTAFEREVTALSQEAGRLSLSLWVLGPSVHCELLSQLTKSRFGSRNVAM
jgi:hypothetical protein